MSAIRSSRQAAPERRMPHEERGFTVVELVIAVSMLIVVLVAVLGMLDLVGRQSFDGSERAPAPSEEATGLAGIVQMLDRAYHVNGPTRSTSSNWLDVQVRIPGRGDTRVLYSCSYADPTSGYRDCVRYEQAGSCGTGCTAGVPPSGVPPVIVVERVLNGTVDKPVFTNLGTPSGSGIRPTFGDVTIETPSAGEPVVTGYSDHRVVLSNVFYIQQLDVRQ